MTPTHYTVAPLLALSLAACSVATSSDAVNTDNYTPVEGASYSQGLATTTSAGLVDCGDGSRVSAVGEITSDDGKVWTLPAATNFGTAAKATDLYNECGGTMLASSAGLDLSSVPLFDAGGTEEFVAYIFADNYFELFVNGALVAVDPVPFTPFNSNVVRFKADRPLKLAVLAVDWEENLGLGSETNRDSNYHPGDAGLVARIETASGELAAITDTSWKAQTFYIAPIADRACLVMTGDVRDSSACSTEAPDDASQYSGAHWTIPDGWMSADFDDSSWPAAVTYSNDTVGVDNKPAYTNFTDIFDAADRDPEFIWTSNLVLDNLVLLRKTVD